jgi:hypothetical protein
VPSEDGTAEVTVFAPVPTITVKVDAPAKRNDAVVSVFKDVFSLFSQQPARQSATVLSPGNSKADRRTRRATENQKRLKRLLESR